jgi:diguanylate cyclase (GGDEF)-like protein
MLQRITRPIRESFSAKIIALVTASVFVSSIVVGIVTIRSTERFLSEKTAEKFPSILNTSKSKIKIFYERQFNDLVRLSQSKVFMDNLQLHLERSGSASTPIDSTVDVELYKYLAIVHTKFPVYERIMVLTESGAVVTGTSEGMIEDADLVVSLIREEGDQARISPAELAGEGEAVHQWLFVPIREWERENVLMAARVNLRVLGSLLEEFRLGKGGDLYILDDRGRFLTAPRFTDVALLGTQGMQVPTRDDGRMEVKKRSSYDGRSVFCSITRLEATGWWIVYEEDYKSAMKPVLNTQTRIWVAVLLIGVVFILVALKIVKSLMRPVHELKLGAERINEGLVGVNIPRGTNDEIGMMIDTFNEMAKTITLSKAELQYKNKMLNTQNDQLQDMNQKLEELSITDGLTGLFNHRHFWNILNTELSRVNMYQGDLALLLIDLDDFKRVNDQFGHAVGDLLLQSVARVQRETVRDTDIVARYGGEEFAILLPDTDRKGVENVSEKIRANVEALRFKVPETDITISVTISVGVSVFRGNRREFFNAADRALYLSKSEGKNCVSYAITA